MFNKNRTSSASLFLMELIIAILVFSVCSAVCLQLFVKSHTVNKASMSLSAGVRQCASVAEICRVSGGERDAREKIRSIYPSVKTDENKLIIYCDENFETCTDVAGDYFIEIDLSTDQEGYMLLRDIQAVEKGQRIYSLSCATALPRRTAYEQK